ncbi:MAG: acetylornithine deacetylase [Hyphomicrobiaceae bacterium]|nr:acetylornithine deacetylase [Hyphomicrobiaceae bacterium]
MKPPVYSALELLDRLVAFDTTSHKSNLPLIRFIEDYLAQNRIASQLVPTHDGAKASLFATIGPAGVPGVALSGHTDVVPVDGQSWTTDPFRLTDLGDRVIGRGTSDMKGFLACVLAQVPELNTRKLAVPIHLAFSYDEEIGCVGVRPMIAEFGERLTKPRMVIVGEPTSMTVVDAHKGPVRWHIDIKGRATHSSMSQLGVNSITYAGRLLAELSRIEERLKRVTDPRFDPPYASLQVTRIEGGTASNIVPVSAWIGFEVRALPQTDTRRITDDLRSFAEAHCLPEMRSVAPEAQITITQTNSVAPFVADADSELTALVLKLSGQNETFAVSYATEAGFFQSAGSAAIICGPGDIAQAHTADEWIAKSQLEACSAFLRRLGDWCEGSGRAGA